MIWESIWEALIMVVLFYLAFCSGVFAEKYKKFKKNQMIDMRAVRLQLRLLSLNMFGLGYLLCAVTVIVLR